MVPHHPSETSTRNWDTTCNFVWQVFVVSVLFGMAKYNVDNINYIYNTEHLDASSKNMCTMAQSLVMIIAMYFATGVLSSAGRDKSPKVSRPFILSFPGVHIEVPEKSFNLFVLCIFLSLMYYFICVHQAATETAQSFKSWGIWKVFDFDWVPPINSHCTGDRCGQGTYEM